MSGQDYLHALNAVGRESGGMDMLGVTLMNIVNMCG